MRIQLKDVEIGESNGYPVESTQRQKWSELNLKKTSSLIWKSRGASVSQVRINQWRVRVKYITDVLCRAGHHYSADNADSGGLQSKYEEKIRLSFFLNLQAVWSWRYERNNFNLTLLDMKIKCNGCQKSCLIFWWCDATTAPWTFCNAWQHLATPRKEVFLSAKTSEITIRVR